MKSCFRLMIAIIIVCGSLTITGNAQTSVGQTMRARIPFAFTVGDKTLPAGFYTVSILNPASDRKVLQIRSHNGHASAIVQTIRAKDAPGNAKLVFRRYGESYFFAKAQMAGEPTSLAATKTRAERAAQRALQQRGRDGSVIAIAAE